MDIILPWGRRQNSSAERQQTDCVKHSPSWEANKSSASQEFSLILWNTDIHYRTHKSPPPILSQINLLHVFPSHFLNIHFNIILHLHLGLSGGLFPSCFPTKHCMHLAYSHTCYMSRPSHTSRYDHTSRTQTACIFIFSEIWCKHMIIVRIIYR